MYLLSQYLLFKQHVVDIFIFILLIVICLFVCLFTCKYLKYLFSKAYLLNAFVFFLLFSYWFHFYFSYFLYLKCFEDAEEATYSVCTPLSLINLSLE